MSCYYCPHCHVFNYDTKLENYIWIIENTNIIIYHNKNINMNIIEKYKYTWDYYQLSKNPNLTEEFILKYPHQDWDIEYLIKNNKITDFKALSKFKNITQNIINKYPDKPWDWEWLIENTDIDIEKYISSDLFKKYRWDYFNIDDHPDFSKTFKSNCIYQFWNKKCLLSYINNIHKTKTSILEECIPINLIEKYKFKWNYNELSKNPSLKEEFILKYPYQNWNIKYLIENNKITDFKSLSRFKYIFKNIIDKYTNKPWDWEWLIENTNIHIEEYISLNLIEKYPYKWNYYRLSKNLNITEEFILKYPYKNWNKVYIIDKITKFKNLIKLNINTSLKIFKEIFYKYKLL